MTSPSSKPSEPESKESEVKVAELVSSSSSNSGAAVSQGLQKSITDFEGFVKLVAENLRYGSWTKRLTTIAAVGAVALNPISAGKVVEAFGVKELPKW